MEEQGIGRPSTYAPTVSTILDREYVIKEGKYLHITNLGRVVTELKKAEQDLDGERIKVPDEVSEEICPECGRNLVVKSGRFGRFLACPGYPDCSFTMPLVVEMPGRCPKCGGRLMKRTGTSKKTNKQYTYYCCEHTTAREGAPKCDFMTWDVPVKDDCPECGHTMFKKAGRGYKRPFCINEACPNFLPEDKRGYPKKPASGEAAGEAAEPDGKAAEKAPEAAKKTAAKKTAVKAAAKKPAAKKPAAKKPAAKKPAKKAAKAEG